MKESIVNSYLHLQYNSILGAVAQRIFDQEISTRKVSRLQQKIHNCIKSTLIRWKDPLISYGIHNYEIKLPLSHLLPTILKNYPYYSSNLARLASYANNKYDDFRLIDIGANVGDSVALLRAQAYFPILCIEGEDYFLKVLQENIAQFSEVSIAPTFVGDANAIVMGEVIGYGGTAHLENIEASTGTSKFQLRRLGQVLEEHPDFLNAKMVKIDTDGFDGKIIRGAVDILERSKPILFFEYDPFFLEQQGDNGLNIFTLLIKCGYSGLIIYDNYGDLLICLPEIDLDRIEEIDLHFSGRKNNQYCDICAFHSEDKDLFMRARASELQFFHNLKK